MSTRTVTVDEIIHALTQMQYSVIQDLDGLIVFRHPEVPGDPIMVDLGKEPYPLPILLASLEKQGINPDAFCAYLD